MIKKIAFNIFLNIAIITLALGIFWSFKHNHYGYATGGMAAVAVFIYMKVQLIKAVRKMTNKL